MTIQNIIEQTEELTIEQKQQLAYYILFSTLNEDKRNSLMHLFYNNMDFDFLKNKDIKKEQVQRTRQPGFLKGKFYMSDDFDAPLEDFKDYM